MSQEFINGDLTAINKISLTWDGSWTVTPEELEQLHLTQGMQSDHQGGLHLLNRRRAMSTVIKYCKGVGLDIGCQWNRITPSTIGIEYQHHQYLNSVWGAHIIRDGTNLSLFADNSMDYLYAGHMLEDVWDPIGCLKEWCRVVKKDGFICLLTPHASYYPRIGMKGCNPAHKFDYWPKHMAEMINVCFGDKVEIVQLETFCNNFEFDLVIRINK